MPHNSFAGPTPPATIQWARALLYFQAGILVLAGAFVVVVGVLLGTGNGIPLAGSTVSGGAAVGLGLLYGALGLGAGYVGVELRSPASWTRNATIGLEAAFIVLLLARGDLSASSIVSLLMCVAIAVLVATASTNAAVGPSRSAVAPKASSPTPEP